MKVMEPAVAHLRPPLLDGAGDDGARREGKTAVAERTLAATGRGGRAPKGSEVHDRLIVTPRIALVELRAGQFGEETPAGGGVDRLGDVEQTRQDAVNVSVHGGIRQRVGRRTDRGGRIVAHAAQRTHPGEGRREAASEVVHDLPGGGMEVPGTAVITQPLPELEHLVFRSGRQRADVGKTPTKRR